MSERVSPDVIGASDTPDRLNLGSGTDHRDGYWNVDASASVDPDLVHDLNRVPWPVPDSSMREIVARHVFEHLNDLPAVFGECARVLRPGGLLEVTVPIGTNAKTDPTHTHEWTWTTPEYFTREGPYDWEIETPFDLVDRKERVWLEGPMSPLSPAFRAFVRRYDPGDWLSATPWLSGELVIVFRRVDP